MDFALPEKRLKYLTGSSVPKIFGFYMTKISNVEPVAYEDEGSFVLLDLCTTKWVPSLTESRNCARNLVSRLCGVGDLRVKNAFSFFINHYRIVH